MNYTNIKEETTNFAKISGEVCEPPKFSHQVEGENFYEFMVSVNRLSENKDIIPVTISERTLLGKEIKLNDFVFLTGEFRSYNKLFNDKSKLILHLFAKGIEILAQPNLEYINEVKLVGYVCKEPTYRTTPYEREICDILLAVNRTNYPKSDYVPCILWGRNARYTANHTIGTKVEVVGRIQSREYTKTLLDGSKEAKIAYEISCKKIATLSNITNLSNNKKVSEEKEII